MSWPKRERRWGRWWQRQWKPNSSEWRRTDVDVYGPWCDSESWTPQSYNSVRINRTRKTLTQISRIQRLLWRGIFAIAIANASRIRVDRSVTLVNTHTCTHIDTHSLTPTESRGKCERLNEAISCRAKGETSTAAGPARFSSAAVLLLSCDFWSSSWFPPSSPSSTSSNLYFLF